MKIKTIPPPIFIAVFFLLAGFLACDLGSFPSTAPLHPPLGLELSSPEAGKIQIAFWGFNNEEVFAGYNIYMAQDESVFSREPGTQVDEEHRIPGNITAVPSRSEPRFDSVRQFTYLIEQDPAENPLNPADTWYITVLAYDGFSHRDGSRVAEILPIAADGADVVISLSKELNK
jgi:hypothetical protein